MEKVVLLCQGREAGSITLHRDGCCTDVWAVMPDPGDGVYRVTLIGEQGQLSLGVMEPGEGGLVLRRRPYSRDVDRLGRLLWGEAGCSPGHQMAQCWRETGCPSRLVHSPFLAERLMERGRAWWRREGELLYLALPVDRKSPFPLESLFCLGRIRCVEGHWCVVYTFDREERPVFTEK